MEPFNINDSQFNMNCTTFTEASWKSLNLVRTVAATIGTVIILAILFFIIYNKVYSSLLQRLYLYLIIATLLAEITEVISIEHLWHYEGQRAVCILFGLLLAWTYVLLFIFSYEIIVYLLYLVVSKIGGTRLPQCGFMNTKCFSLLIEILSIFIPVATATAFSLPPLVQNKYGIAGPWCFVRSLNNYCEPSGYSTQMTFYGMYMTLGVAGIVTSLIFIVVYFRLAASFKEARHLLKQTLYVLGFKFIHILMILCSVACRVYTLESRRHERYGLWLAHALAFPIGPLVFPLGYFICFHSVGMFVKSCFKMKCCRRKHTPASHVEIQSITGIDHATIPKSDRISQPSYTFFDVPHSVDTTESDSERSPVINDHDTGHYGSTHFIK